MGEKKLLPQSNVVKSIIDGTTMLPIRIIPTFALVTEPPVKTGNWWPIIFELSNVIEGLTRV